MIWLLDPQKSISLYQKSQCFFLKRLSLEMIRIIECILPSCYHYRNCYCYRTVTVIVTVTVTITVTVTVA